MAFQYLNRCVKLPMRSEEVQLRMSAVHDEWQMTDAERSTLKSMLESLKPEVAIEVGVYRAGSLALLSANCGKVYALDIDPYCAATYASRFPNVEFITAPSTEGLPKIIDRIQATREPLSFVLIDADHSEEGVRRDIDSLLKYRPNTPL